MWGGIRPEGTQLEKAPTGEGVGVQSLEPDHYSVNDFLAIDAWQVETLYVCMCAYALHALVCVCVCTFVSFMLLFPYLNMERVISISDFSILEDE